MRFIELGVLFLIALLLTLFAVRPLIKRILSVEEAEPQGLLSADGQPMDNTMIADQSSDAGIEVDEDGEPRIEWLEEAQAQGAVQVATIAKVGGLIEEYPNEAVGIIRSWMNEAA